MDDVRVFGALAAKHWLRPFAPVRKRQIPRIYPGFETPVCSERRTAPAPNVPRARHEWSSRMATNTQALDFAHDRGVVLTGP